MLPPAILRSCAAFILLASSSLMAQQGFYHHQLEALSSHPQQEHIAALLAATPQGLDPTLFSTELPVGRASVGLTNLFSAQAGSWPFEPFAGSGLFRVIADYQAHHPQALLLDNGSLSLVELAQRVNDPRVLQPHKDGYLLSYPLLIGPKGALRIENARLYLNSRGGAALINRGQLILRQAHLQSWSGEQAQLSAQSFRPFVMAWAGSTTLIEDSELSRLGYNAHLARGLTSMRSQQQAAGTPAARVLIRASQFSQMSSGAELHDAQALIEDSRFSDLQQYGLDLSASLVSVRSNQIRGVRNHSAIRLRNGSSGSISHNLLSDIGKSAIEAQLQQGALALQNNLIGATGASAIALQGDPQQPVQGLLLAGNLIANSAGSGIEGQHISRALIIDNRISGTPEYAIRIINQPAQANSEISLLDNRLSAIGKSMINLQGFGNLLLGNNSYQGMAGLQRVFDGDLLAVQSLLLETTLKYGCVAHLQVLPGSEELPAPHQAPRCGQSI